MLSEALDVFSQDLLGCKIATVNTLMNRFKHSGAFGDLIYSLPIVKHFGGGEFYLHLDQLNWVGQHYYGSAPNPFHKGRMTAKDLESLRPLLEAQDYITRVDSLDPSSTEITHNLDKFRVPFVGHPGNYVDIYADVFGIKDPEVKSRLRNEAWLTVPEVKTVEGRTIAVNRTHRWIAPTLPEEWTTWKEEAAKECFFLGLPDEYEKFIKDTGWDIPYVETQNLLEMAQYIAGADQYIGNQSVGLALAIGLGAQYLCEIRRDLPAERNECFFPLHPFGEYF